MESMRKVTIKEIREVSEGSYILSIGRDFSFEPGQVLAINIGNAQPARLYSIASGNDESDARILFNIKDDGYLTPRLAKCKKGEQIEISEPFGTFICREKNAFWISAGTGIAPFVSMALSGQSEGKTLIHGSRKLSGFYFRNEMADLMGNRYIPCCSSENGNGIYQGRLTQYLKETELIDPGLKYYLCGSAEMVVDTRDILISRGVPYDKLVAEIYF
jgi:ferredoxin/flavodoxin---NADP+ reductase